MFEERSAVRLPGELPPALLVVVDTEEEFDWDAGFDRNATAITAIEHIGRLQDVLDSYGIRPTYLIDYPIASRAEGVQALRGYVDSGRAFLGAHLHGWVNPPFEEEVNHRNSYQGNLPVGLEAAKLRVLRDAIAEGFGRSPTIHKAGRYGFGMSTAGILAELGFEIDISATPGFDWRGDGGPDYRRLEHDAFWFGPQERLFGIPNTGGFIGPLRHLGPSLYRVGVFDRRFGNFVCRALSKSRLLERILLSPEGHSYDKMARLTRQLVAWGCRVLTLSLHSPTLKPGCTFYTTTQADLMEFLAKCRRYFDFFFGELSGVTLSPEELRELAVEHTVTAEPRESLP